MTQVQTSQWERPEHGWLAVFDESTQHTFYENLATGESVWELPEDVAGASAGAGAAGVGAGAGVGAELVVWDACQTEDESGWFYSLRAPQQQQQQLGGGEVVSWGDHTAETKHGTMMERDGGVIHRSDGRDMKVGAPDDDDDGNNDGDSDGG